MSKLLNSADFLIYLKIFLMIGLFLFVSLHSYNHRKYCAAATSVWLNLLPDLRRWFLSDMIWCRYWCNTMLRRIHECDSWLSSSVESEQLSIEIDISSSEAKCGLYLYVVFLFERLAVLWPASCATADRMGRLQPQLSLQEARVPILLVPCTFLLF